MKISFPGGEMSYFLSAAFLKVSAISALIFVLIDLLWLSVVGENLYFNTMGYLAEIKDGKIVFNLKAVITVQVIIAVGLVFFISMALIINNTLLNSIAVGAISGFITWGTVQVFFADIYV
jgi:uncharacterized membrane protein